MATNGAFGDVWQGMIGDRKVAVKVMRYRKAKEADRTEKVIIHDMTLTTASSV